MRNFNLLVFCAAFAFAAAARGQCTKDTDCKGDRVCSGGECVAPVTPPPPRPVEVAPAPPAATDLSARPMLSQPSHWARPAGWVGIGASVVVLGFGVAAAATSGDTAASVGSGAVALVAAAVAGPIVGVGGASARFDAGLNGVPALRIVGWIGYGITMVGGAAMVISGFFVTYPSVLILGVSGFGALSLIALSVDALVSASQADEYLAQAPPRAEGPRVLPSFALVRTPSGALSPTVTFAGRF